MKFILFNASLNYCENKQLKKKFISNNTNQKNNNPNFYITSNQNKKYKKYALSYI